MERIIRIEKNEVYREDYQMRMIKENDIRGLMPVKGTGVEGKSVYEYDVSGKKSMKRVYEKRRISGREICSFLRQLQGTINHAEEHLLSVHNIILDSAYVFIEKETYSFCYNPANELSFWDAFHRLSEDFVKWTDYKDEQGVRIMFILHRESMEGNYSLERLIRECEDELEAAGFPEETEEETSEEEPDEKEEAGEKKQWGRGLWRRKKKANKWGKWEGI